MMFFSATTGRKNLKNTVLHQISSRKLFIAGWNWECKIGVKWYSQKIVSADDFTTAEDFITQTVIKHVFFVLLCFYSTLISELTSRASFEGYEEIKSWVCSLWQQK